MEGPPRVSQFLDIANTPPASVPFKYKPTNPELTPQPSLLWGSYTQGHCLPALITQSQVPENWGQCLWPAAHGRYSDQRVLKMLTLLSLSLPTEATTMLLSHFSLDSSAPPDRGASP